LSKTLTSGMFSELVKGMRLSEDQIRRAKRVLVDGESAKDVADDEGVSEQTVRVDCRRIVGNLRQTVKLTEGMFNGAVRQLSRMTERNVELAKRVLVNGEPLATVAKEAGISAPTLSAAIRRIKDKAVPRGWRMVSVLLPEHLADAVEKMAADERKHLDID